MVTGCVQTSATVVRTLGFRADVARRAASGLLLATEVADYLVGRGLPVPPAHEVTGRIVRELCESGRDFSALGLEDWRRYTETFDEGIFKAITPEAAVAARRTPQSTSPRLSPLALGHARLAGAAAHRAFVKGGGHGRRSIR